MKNINNLETEPHAQSPTRYRIWLTKEKDSKYLSHHDIAQIVEQAIRRAGLFVCLGGKYNPRLKISYFSSVPVGVSSLGEPVDILFDREICSQNIQETLQAKLPSELNITKIEKIAVRGKYDLEIHYSIAVSCQLCPQKGLDLLQNQAIWVTRTHKQRNKECNVRPFIKKCTIQSCLQGSSIELIASMTLEGSVTPWEILALLAVPLNDPHVTISVLRTAVHLIPRGN